MYNEYAAAILIGVACALLQPKQPRSMIATVLLILALHLYTHQGA